MAKSDKSPQLDKVIVAGHGSFIDDKNKLNVYVIVKNAVAKDSRFKLQGKNKATKTGTIWAAAGMTLEEMKAEVPVATELKGFAWGEEKDTQYGGVFHIEEVQ